MDIDTYKAQCEKSVDLFKRKIGDSFAYIPNGIMLWEGFAFCAMLDLLDIDLIIESGVAGGRSTEIWAKYTGKKIYAVDNARTYGEERFEETVRRLSYLDNIEFINGNAFFELPRLIKQNRGRTIALFIDGPKGIDAITLAKHCFRYEHVRCAGIHDQCKGNYHEMDVWNRTVFYTDAPWFLEKYASLESNSDNPEFQEELRNNPGGPGIGIAVNSGIIHSNAKNHKTIRWIKDSIIFNKLIMSATVDEIKWYLKKNHPVIVNFFKNSGFFNQ